MPGFPAFPSVRTGTYGAAGVGAAREAKPAILEAGFGGAYGQRTGDGVNSMRRDHSYRSPPMRQADISTLDNFLVGRKGYLPFTYLVPGEASPRQFTCKSWRTDYSTPTHWTLSAAFEENFDP